MARQLRQRNLIYTRSSPERAAGPLRRAERPVVEEPVSCAPVQLGASHLASEGRVLNTPLLAAIGAATALIGAGLFAAVAGLVAGGLALLVLVALLVLAGAAWRRHAPRRAGRPCPAGR